MPIYTCTNAESTLSADTKRALAGEIARIHSSINDVLSTYVNVAFHELSADGLYTDGNPASPVVSGWVREGGVNTIDVPVDYSHNTNLSPSFMTACWSGAPGALSIGTIAGRLHQLDLRPLGTGIVNDNVGGIRAGQVFLPGAPPSGASQASSASALTAYHAPRCPRRTADREHIAPLGASR